MKSVLLAMIIYDFVNFVCFYVFRCVEFSHNHQVCFQALKIFFSTMLSLVTRQTSITNQNQKILTRTDKVIMLTCGHNINSKFDLQRYARPAQKIKLITYLRGMHERCSFDDSFVRDNIKVILLLCACQHFLCINTLGYL